MRRLFFALSSLCAVLPAAARQPVTSALPSSAYADTEVSTNVPFTAWEAHQKRFAYRLSFEATPSNNVQVAFGNDADADGVLGPDEERLVVGWDCGEWFVFNATNGVRLVDAARSTSRAQALAFVFETRSDGAVKSLSLSSDGVGLFPSLAATPPKELYDTRWDMFRLTARGVDDPHAGFRVQTIPCGFSFIFR
ncbi:MAG: hypothetical protein Q4G65_12940 [bacterium]|nr:hypothetical protein [bacterium]